MNQSKKNRGFSLIEVMIVMAIVAILSAVAIPAYTNHISKSMRAEAAAQLQLAAQYMQRFYAANDAYDVDRSGKAIDKIMPAHFMQSPSEGTAIYKITFGKNASTVDATEFKLLMTPVAGGRMAKDKCGSLSLDSYGRKSATGSVTPKSDCWR